MKGEDKQRKGRKELAGIPSPPSNHHHHHSVVMDVEVADPALLKARSNTAASASLSSSAVDAPLAPTLATEISTPEKSGKSVVMDVELADPSLLPAGPNAAETTLASTSEASFQTAATSLTSEKLTARDDEKARAVSTENGRDEVADSNDLNAASAETAVDMEVDRPEDAKVSTQEKTASTTVVDSQTKQQNQPSSPSAPPEESSPPVSPKPPARASTSSPSASSKTPSVPRSQTPPESHQPTTTKPPPSSSSTPSPAPKTPQELHQQIKQSRDKLFFISYSLDDKVEIVTSDTGDKINYQWYLVRVDLETCRRIDEARNCRNTGEYYVEFYTKARVDQGVPSNSASGVAAASGIGGSGIGPVVKPDRLSRWWLEWHEFRFKSNGEMVLGKAKEFNPNSKTAVRARWIELSKKINDASANGVDGLSEQEEVDEESSENRLQFEYAPNLDKFTTWADVVNLMDENTRLVGPFDFEDILVPDNVPLDGDLFLGGTLGASNANNVRNAVGSASMEAERKLIQRYYSKLYVRDCVPKQQWKQLLDATLAMEQKGKLINPPTMEWSDVRKTRTRRCGKCIECTKPDCGKCKYCLSRAGKANSTRWNKYGCKERAKCFLMIDNHEEWEQADKTMEERQDKQQLSGKKRAREENEMGLVSQGGTKRDVMVKDDILALVERALEKTNHTEDDGKTYFEVKDFQQKINELIDCHEKGQHINSIPEKTDVNDNTAIRSKLDFSTIISEQKETKVLSAQLEPPKPLKPLPETGFTEEEILNFPVAFAYHIEGDVANGKSEENAKIASLDYEVEKRRERQNAIKGDVKTKSPLKKMQSSSKKEVLSVSATSKENGKGGGMLKSPPSKQSEKKNASTKSNLVKPTTTRPIPPKPTPTKPTTKATQSKSTSKSSPSKASPHKTSSTKKTHPSASTHPTHAAFLDYPPRPAEGFPTGWTIRIVPRASSNNKTNDTYWFSPKCGFKFRSRPEVRRFLQCLKAAKGDENKAIAKFKK